MNLDNARNLKAELTKEFAVLLHDGFAPTAGHHAVAIPLQPSLPRVLPAGS